MNNNQNSNEKNQVDSTSNSLIVAIQQLWQIVNSIVEKHNNINQENKELRLKVVEFDNIWDNYNKLIDKVPDLERKANLFDQVSKDIKKLKQENYDIKQTFVELNEIKKNFSLAQKEFASKNLALHERAETIQDLKDEIAVYQNEIQEFEKKIDEIHSTDRAIQLQKEVDKLKASLFLKDKDHNKEKVELINKIDELQIIVDNDAKTLNEYSHNLLTIKQEKAELEKYLGKIDELQQTINIKDNELEQNILELKRLNAVIVNYKEKIKELDYERNNLEKQYKILEDEKFSLNDKVFELSHIKNEFQKLNDSIKVITEENHNLNIDLNAKTKDFESLKLELGNQKNQNDELKEVLSKKEQELQQINDLKFELISKNDENELLKSEIQELNQKKDEINDDIVIELNKKLAELSNNAIINSKKIEALTDLNQEKDIKIKNLSNEKSSRDENKLDIENKNDLVDRIDEYLAKLEKIIS